MSQAPAIDLFGYLDIRSYLRDVYEARKASGRPFSYRAFSRRAGLSSPNHLKRVIDGERSLTGPMAVRYAKALGLEGDEASYFCDLAAFARARTAAEKNLVYERLMAYRGYQEARRLDLAQAAYHAHWWIPAIRELAVRPDFQADPAWIAGRMWPSIPKAEAARALDVLFELGLLVRQGDGRVVQGEPVVTTGPETRGLHIGNYHRAMMTRAAASIDHVPAPLRDISSVTFCIGPDGLSRIKDRIRRFRQEIIALANDEAEIADRVIQLNMQLFPLSTARSEEPS